MAKKKADHPKILVFPPLIPLGLLLAGVALGYLLPVWGQTPHLTRGLWLTAGAFLTALGYSLILASQVHFKRAGTPVYPYEPTRQIVASGPFRYTRNPMYIGLNLMLLGLSLLFFLPWVWAGFLIGLPLNHWGVVLQEEIYLEKKFGKKYLDYKKRVRRWI